MARKYFGTDGIRGRVGEGHINPEFVLKLGWAAGRVLGNGEGSKVLIGKDTRISGYMFEAALEAGLAAAGVDIRMLGPMPTPAIAYLTRTLHASAGIVISASHNPHEDNGIKFFSASGNKLPDAVEEQIEDELGKPMTTVSSSRLGKAKRLEDARGRYIEFCKSTIPSRLDFRGLKVVVDCAHGATYHIAPDVFEEIGAEVIAIGAEPNGLNINEGFGATKPRALASSVRVNGAHLGIALDGDGDRVIMVDETGEIVDGDEILYIIARSRLTNGGLQGSVVGTHMSNLGLEVALRDLGVGFERVAVGDRYILERLSEQDWTLGGEASGHIICRDRTTTGDGIVSALQVLAEINKSGKTLGELRGGMVKFPQELINVPLGGARAADVMASKAVVDAVRSVESAMGAEGRVLLRPSGTEPLIRVMVEGREAAVVTSNANAIAEAVRHLVAA
ncbi:MAG: phosphoglucosamine mutase [Chromatiaceae bacterium]|nr:phosphoglucosamine mutase [Chromatiaceae bacterium]MCP5437209.1 phosphoglucosamine mutase [Chromatiaceae bacterium]MCP5439342.1 phosphoglucosamine mutase [Chromatiaceae bacterium]